MRREIVVKGRSLGGSSDLTLLAPLRPGFVESLEAVTHKTRVKRLLDALHGGRVLSHEQATARFLSDSVERVGVIHSVRVAVLEPEDKVLLAVTFDGPWEAYIRVLWDKVGTLLDLIFNDTVDYVTAFDHTFEEWRVWAQRVQIQTGFFYGPAESTARDAFYWRRVERMRERLGAGLVDRPGGAAPTDAARVEAFKADRRAQLRASLPSAEDAVARLAALGRQGPADEPVYAGVLPPRMLRECLRHGLRGLSVLYRLTDLYRPGTPDGEVLLRAARDLLREFVYDHAPAAPQQIAQARHGKDPSQQGRGRFARQLDWLMPASESLQPPTKLRPPPEGKPLDEALLASVQGGILRPYDNVTHGLIVFVAFEHLTGGADFAEWIGGRLTHGGCSAAVVGGEPLWNVAFTPAGLRALGLSDDALERFPEEFRVGMAARAGLLGDVRNNHPSRWRLPPAVGAGDGVFVDPATAHAAVMLCCAATPNSPQDAAVDTDDPDHPLRAALASVQGLPGVRAVAVQPLKRRFADPQRTQIREHFGFVDGNGQPEVEARPPRFDQNLVHLGEVLIGRETASDAAAVESTDEDVRETMNWLGDGSFLVMRKYRQYVGRLTRAVDAVATDQLGGAVPDARQLVLAKMMGRWPGGAPLADAPGGPPRNNFTYDDDDGGGCPLGAHIRLANPRAAPLSAARIPRLMRRGMSYGPSFESSPDDETDRGLVFMCFASSIAEQYEVVQRWLSGGNSTGTGSGQGCPFIGVPDNGVQKTFRFEYPAPGEVHPTRLAQVDLDPSTRLFEEPSALTRLEWGVYLFSPSIDVMDRLRSTARSAAMSASAGGCPVAAPWRPQRGRELIASLRRTETGQGAEAACLAWKAVLEDPDSVDRLDAAAVWAAVRDDHGGVLTTPCGTLVASRALLCQVLRDREGRYSVAEHFERMESSFGGVALGLDRGEDYWTRSDAVNDAIHGLTAGTPGDGVFRGAFAAARQALDALVADARQQSLQIGDARFEVSFDIREILDEVLASLSDAWFGLHEAGDFFVRGAVDWGWQPNDKPSYPGQFTALSRYIFQPNPGPVPTELGQAYGRALHDAMLAFVCKVRQDDRTRVPSAPGGAEAPIAAAIFRHGRHGQDDDFVARTATGVLMGFTPTIIGAVLNVLKEWFSAGEVGRLRARLAQRTDLAAVAEVVHAPMAAAARMRPMPAMLWRTVRSAHRLGTPGSSVALAVGDKVVLGLSSGTQQSLADGGDPHDSARLMFGGRRNFDGNRDHPTHACPGYEAGIQAMLGTLGALLTVSHTLRAGSSFSAFSIEGTLTGPASTPRPAEAAGLPPAASPRPASIPPGVRALATPAALRFAAAAFAEPVAGTLMATPAIRPDPPRRTGLVLGWGDSWLGYVPPDLDLLADHDLRDFLARFGYDAPGKYCSWIRWRTLERMDGGADGFCGWLRERVQASAPQSLKAIVLSGGGNDVSGPVLQAMLEPWSPHLVQPFKPDALDACMADLLARYVSIVRRIDHCLEGLRLEGSLRADVPVVIHGYDYPFPLGKPWGRVPETSWLYDPFEAAGYKLGDPAAGEAAVGALRVLMQRFRGVLANVEAAFPRRVRRVDLLGSIETCWPARPSDQWDNDLHPSAAAFRQFAVRIDDAIAAPTWPPVTH